MRLCYRVWLQFTTSIHDFQRCVVIALRTKLRISHDSLPRLHLSNAFIVRTKHLSKHYLSLMMKILAVASVAATIAQLVDFSGKILRRLNEFHSSLGEIPESLRQINTQLPLLLDILKDTQHIIGTGVIRNDTEKALLPVINDCRVQIESLDGIIDKVLPLSSDSWAKRSKKALSSLIKHEPNVNRITSALGNNVQTLTFYHSAARSAINPLKGTPCSILQNRFNTNIIQMTSWSRSDNGSQHLTHRPTTKRD